MSMLAKGAILIRSVRTKSSPLTPREAVGSPSLKEQSFTQGLRVSHPEREDYLALPGDAAVDLLL